MTKENAKAAFQVTAAIAESIRELGEVPAGTIYAQLMGKISLENFESIVALLVRTKLVERDATHLLRWVGPKF